MSGSNASITDAKTVSTGGIPAIGASMLALMLGPSVILILSFGTFMPVLSTAYGWSIPKISFGASIISITIMIISPLQGWLVDRYGTRAVVLAFMPVWSIALMLMRFLPNDITIFYLACLLLPIASLGLWPLSFMRLTTTWFDRHLGLALGAVNLSVGLAAAILPVLLAFAFATIGWRGAYLTLGAAVLVLAWPVAAIWLRQGPRGQAIPGGAAPIGISFAATIRSRVFWLMAFNFFILGIISTGLLVHEVAILIDAGVAPTRAIYIQSAIGIGSILGRIGAGWLLDRVAVQRIGMGVFAIAGIACLLLASPLAGSASVLAAATVGIVVGAEFDVLGMLIRRYQGIAAFGRIFGVVFSAFQLGGAVGAAGLGIGRASMGSYAPALIVIAVLAGIGGALFLFFGSYRYPKEQADARGAGAAR